MKEIESGSFSTFTFPRGFSETVRVVSWNINRGLDLNGIVQFLQASCADLILLQEVDINTRRTGRRNLPREIAQALQMNYIFGREFEELAQGGAGNPAYHGQCTLSRLPLLNPRMLAFRSQSTFWRPRWFIPTVTLAQRRLGARMALICEVPLGVESLLICNVHLESRGCDELRIRQLSEILAEIEQLPSPARVLLAGDFNCDLFRGAAQSLVAGSGANSPFASFDDLRTTLKGRNGRPAAIDWMLTRGRISAERATVHACITASDHFPLSVDLHLC